MYMNVYQKYIDELLSEYGSLLESQLLKMINSKFENRKQRIDGYVLQMCRFGDYELADVGGGTAVCIKDKLPDYDIIRAFEVMLAFMPKVTHHRKSKDLISMTFVVDADGKNKEFFVIPVNEGEEHLVSSFTEDKFDNEPNQVIIFLLTDKQQLKRIKVSCNHRFAVINKNGVKFIKHIF